MQMQMMQPQPMPQVVGQQPYMAQPQPMLQPQHGQPQAQPIFYSQPVQYQHMQMQPPMQMQPVPMQQPQPMPMQQSMPMQQQPMPMQQHMHQPMQMQQQPIAMQQQPMQMQQPMMQPMHVQQQPQTQPFVLQPPHGMSAPSSAYSTASSVMSASPGNSVISSAAPGSALERPGIGQACEDPRNLIVNYIPTPVTDTELRQLFEQFGDLESARVILDRVTQHPKGYGFVKYRRMEDARAAMEAMNGFEIHNKRLKVTTAKGPHNAAISNHTQRLQSYVASSVTQQQMQAPQQLQPQMAPANPAPQMHSQQMMHPQPYSMQQAPQGQSPYQVQYVVVDANMQQLSSGPYTGAVSLPTSGYGPQVATRPANQQAPAPVVFQPINLPPQSDPMYRDSCRFSLHPSTYPQGPASHSS